MVRQRVRIRFAKLGDLRLISHRDLMRTWERLFRRAAVSLSMSEGFHPKPRIMFPSALAVGIAGLDEILDVDLSTETTADELQQAITPQLPAGLVVHSIEVLVEQAGKAQVARVAFAVPVPHDRQTSVRGQVDRVLSAESLVIQREGRAQPLDLRPLVDGLTLDGDVLHMQLRVAADGSARPREVLAAIGLGDVESLGLVLTRTRVELHA